MSKLKELWRMDLLAEQGSSFSCISELYIRGCFDLASVHLPPSLSRLEICNCSNLASLELPSPSSLSRLEIRYCSNFVTPPPLLAAGVPKTYPKTFQSIILKRSRVAC